MPSYTLTGDLDNAVGGDLDFGTVPTRAFLIPYAEAVSAGGDVHLGSIELALAADGSFTQPNVPLGGWRVEVRYYDVATRQVVTWSTHFFNMDADKDLTEIVAEGEYVAALANLTIGSVTVGEADVNLTGNVLDFVVPAGGQIILASTAVSGTAYTVTAPDHGEKRIKLTLTGNAALSLSGGTAGEVCAVQLHLIQDATAGRTVTWPSTLDWGAAGAPVLSALTGKTDRVYLTTDDGGASWQGAIIGAGYSSPIQPSAPTGLSGSVSSGDVVLTWTQGAANGSTVTQNKIYRRVSGVGSYALLTTIAANTTYTDTTPLTDGTTYDYKVSAVNTIGEGAQSNTYTVTPGALVVTSDNFNRTDTATGPTDGLIGELTPVGSDTWVNALGTGTWSTNGTKAVANGANRIVIADSGVSDCTVSVDIAQTGAAANEGIVFRWVNSTNNCGLVLDPTGFVLQKNIAGTVTTVATLTPGPGTAFNGRVSVKMSGSTITVFVNGTQVGASQTISDAAVLTATKHGFRTGGTATSTNPQFDNYEVTVP